MTREDFAIAEPLFRRAIELDPDFAMPHMGLAYVRLWTALFHWTGKPADALTEGVASARTALALNPLASGAHSTLGVLLSFTGKLDEALAASRKAIEIDPSGAIGYACLGVVHMYRSEPGPGIRAIETAIRLSPNDMNLHHWLAALSGLHYQARNYAKAAEIAQIAVQRAPQSALGWRPLASALGQLGRLDEAGEALAQFLALSPGFSSEQAARATSVVRDEAAFQHYLEGLRKAGWTG